MEQFGAENEGDLKEKLTQTNMGKVPIEPGGEQQAQNCSEKREYSSGQCEKAGGKGDSSWELDSGTHDLSSDPLQQIMSAATNATAKGQSRSANFLELANTVSFTKPWFHCRSKY